MYDDREIMISREYLTKVLEVIDGPVALMGGWAVYLKVNDAFRSVTGREYLGSRDIDLGFHISKDGRNRSLNDVHRLLTDELGFERLSFRLFKQIDIDSGEELDRDTAMMVPMYRIFPIYVDLIVDNVLVDFRDRFGFHPVNEELLSVVFKEHVEKDEIEFLGKDLILPSTNVLLSMKVRSFPRRDKEHKRIKDLCDILALSIFRTDWDPGSVLRFATADSVREFAGSLEANDIADISRLLDLEVDLIKNGLGKLIDPVK